MGCGASKAPVSHADPLKRRESVDLSGVDLSGAISTHDAEVVQKLVDHDTNPDGKELLMKSCDVETGMEIVWPESANGVEEERGKWKKARARLLRTAHRIGAAREALNCPPRHVMLIYNPISGGGKSKALVDDVVVPIFRMAGVDFTLIRTEFQGFCTKYIKTLAVGSCDCIAIAGGDGLLLEAVTGYMDHSDTPGLMRQSPLASIPTGTANAMSHQLHHAESGDYCTMVGCAALSCAIGGTSRVDMFKVSDNGSKIPLYALSCFGWGMAAIITEKAETLRKSVPKSIRYDVATAICVVKTWPLSVAADLQYKETHDGEWIHDKDFTVGNFLASNMPRLGPKHIIHSGVAVDDGAAGIVYTLPTAKKVDLWRANNKMKVGQALSDAKGWESAVFTEFKIRVPERNETNSCIMLDGDPVPLLGDEIHVEVLEKALPIHHLPFMLKTAADPGTSEATDEIEHIVKALREVGGSTAGARSSTSPSRPIPTSLDGLSHRRSLASIPKPEVLPRRTEKGMGKVSTCPDGIRIMSRPLQQVT